MTEVVSVRFRGGCKNYDFSPGDRQIKMGDQVIVETAQGLEFATCTEGNHELEDAAVVRPLSNVIRMATENDRRTVEYNRRRESEAFDACEKKIEEHGLDMKLVNVSCSFEGTKIIFYFTADGRVDFRELVRDLAGVFRARIELRQIGVRDEAKMIGGLGICGRPFCCSQFLDSFLPVSIKMAKTQNLSLNPAKISGTCGRLMCCLKYEQNAYEDAMKRMPKAESFVQTPDGPGNVRSVNLLKETVKVSLDAAPEPQKTYRSCEIRVLRNGKGSREGIEIPRERPDRYVEEREEESELQFVSSEPLMAAGDLEELPSRERIAPPQEGERRSASRRRRGGKSGGKKPESSGGPVGKPQPPRPARPKAQVKPQPPKGDRPAGEKPRPEKGEGGQPSRRPRHRGGRRRGGGGGQAGGASAE